LGSGEGLAVRGREQVVTLVPRITRGLHLCSSSARIDFRVLEPGRSANPSNHRLVWPPAVVKLGTSMEEKKNLAP